MPEPDHLIFVNYRGSDEIWATEYVYARMTDAFGEAAVFKAGNALRPGDMFSPVLTEKAARCPVMLACVGPTWLTASGPDGRRRLESPDDWVRREIAIALQAGNRVIPLLLGDRSTVAAPDPAQLPPDIRDLSGLQVRWLTPGAGLPLTVRRLIEELVELEPALRARRQSLTPPPEPSGTATPAPSSAADPVGERIPITGHVHNEISGGTYNGPVIMGRDFSGDITG